MPIQYTYSVVNTTPNETTLRYKALEEKIAKMKNRVDAMKEDVRRLWGTMYPLLPVNLQTLLDAHLFQIGYNPDCSTRTEFISAHLASVADALGLDVNTVSTFLEFTPDADEAAYMVTSVGIADTILRCRMSSSECDMWERIFHHTFGRTIEEGWNRADGMIHVVYGQWPLEPGKRRFEKLTENREIGRSCGGDEGWLSR